MYISTENTGTTVEFLPWSSDSIVELSLTSGLLARELALKHISYFNVNFSEAKALFMRKPARQWGHTIARARATLLLDRLHDLVVAPSSGSGRGTGQAASDVDDEAAFDHVHRLHSRNGRNANTHPTSCALFSPAC